MSIRDNRYIDYDSPLGGELFTFFDVQPVNGVDYDWGAIPFSGVLNRKSKKLPMQYTSDTNVQGPGGIIYGRRTQLSEAMIKAIDYGRDFKAYDSALTAIRGVAAGDNFNYIYPTEWHRLADLYGYDHEQPDWFSFSTRVSSLSFGGTTFVNHENLDDIFSFGKLSGLSASSVNFGFLMWNAAFSANQPQVYFYSCTNMGNQGERLDMLLTGNEGLSIKANSNNNGLGQGVWRMYPVVTTASFGKDSFNYIREETANGKWYPFPFANTHVLTIVGSGQGEDDLIGNIDASLEMCDIRLLDAASLTYTLHSLSVTFSNTGNASYEVYFDWSIKDAYDTINQPQSHSGSAWVSKNDTTTVELFSIKYEEDAYRFSVGETPVILNLAYWIKTDMGEQENMVTIELESK